MRHRLYLHIVSPDVACGRPREEGSGLCVLYLLPSSLSPLCGARLIHSGYKGGLADNVPSCVMPVMSHATSE